MTPKTPEDAIGGLIVLALLHSAAAAVLAFVAVGSRSNGVGAGVAAGGFAIGGGLIVLAAVLLSWVYLSARDSSARPSSPPDAPIPPSA
jgi:hypothetical protein